MSTTEYRLTTVDNPYDPFEDFEHWFLYDVEKGYNTCGYLARVLNLDPLNAGPNLNSDNIDQSEINRAIDTIIKDDFMNIYRRVKNPHS